MALCPNCGQNISPEARFCGGCGNVVAPASPAPPAEVIGSSAAGAQWTPVPTPAVPAPTPAPSPVWSGVAPASAAPATISLSNSGWTPVPSTPPSPPMNATTGVGFMRADLPAASPNVAPATGWVQTNAAPNVAAGNASSSGWAPVSASPVAAQAASPSASSGLSSNQAAALSYLLGPITGVIFLVLDPYKQDRFVRFHAMQSIVYSVACIAFSVVWSVAVDILIHISGWIALLAFPIRLLISLGMFALWLYAMYQAYNHREFSIPLLGPIAARQVK